MNETRLRAALACTACEQTCAHDLVYAGRLLVSTRCTACGHLEQHDASTLRSDYLHDVEHRLRTKPARIGRRLARDPLATLRGLPIATVRKPVRMAREVLGLIRRR